MPLSHIEIKKIIEEERKAVHLREVESIKMKQYVTSLTVALKEGRISNDFEIPTCENDIIFLFGSLYHILGFSKVKFRTRYPDATMILNGEIKKVEFEYKAYSFKSDKHNVKE